MNDIQSVSPNALLGVTMSLKDAEKLILDIRSDADLRNGAYLCNDGISLQSYFSARGYIFNDYEWEDAANSMRLKAADEEAAAELMDIREWYRHMRSL
jgi:hypothetical protein